MIQALLNHFSENWWVYPVAFVCQPLVFSYLVSRIMGDRHHDEL